MVYLDEIDELEKDTHAWIRIYLDKFCKIFEKKLNEFI